MNILCIVLSALLAPFFIGVINQTKAFFGGRKGPGLFRLYFDIRKLLCKTSVRAHHTTWIFDIAQSVSLASVVIASIVFPWTGGGGVSSLIPAVLFFYILAAGRIFTVLGALDAGNAFEGMGASREVQFSALAEPIVFIVLGFLVFLSKDVSLSGILSGISVAAWKDNVIPLVLVFLAFVAVLLVENCRVPFDDPETHLELTMIHEAMLLDVGGPDLAFALYGAALKFELLAAFLIMMFMPNFGNGWLHILLLFSGIGLVSIATGVIESVMARMRFLKSPQTLMCAALIASLAVLIFVCF
jgi:formate hydrogenlyase subunit 4